MLALLALSGVVIAPAGAAESGRTARFRQKQLIRTDRVDILRPSGLAYAGDCDLFLVFPAAGSAAEPAASRGELLDRFHQSAGAIALPVPLTAGRAVAYDRLRERVLVLDVAARALFAIPGGAAGEFDTGRVTRLEAPRAAALRPVGMTVDPTSGEVFVLDRLMRRILRFVPADGPAGAVPDHRWVDLGPLAAADLTGLAFDPQSGHLFTLDAGRRTVHEITTDATPVASYDVSSIELSDPQSLVFAPSGDQTDDPATWSLFVADPGGPGTRRGQLVELGWASATPMVQESIQATTAAALVRVTKTSQFSPPSPDPSGVSYNSTSGRLVISDAEVEEMNIWAGKNVFETSLAGALLRSYSVTSFNIEPCGNAYNPNNRHQFISNDDADIVWDVNPGGDGLIGTSDDTRTSFKTNAFGSGDPEGVSYDPTGNRIFIADGVNEEIYVVGAGANGVFNGVPPTGDDVVSHFDTHALSETDPETVEWKPDTGTLLLLGSTGSKIVKEVTTTGTVLAQTDISFAPLSKPAGLAYAPSSGGGGWSYYIVCRGVDNNSDPSENDGTLVEISVGGTATNAPPSVNAGPDQTITLPAQATLDGTVSDDGLPSPPTVTTTWSKVSGPGTVTFGNANAVDTQASFSASGTYVLQLSASDGQLSASDQVQITVQASTGNTAPTVNAGPDQTITLPAQATLDGTVSDDGLPSPPTVTTTWSKVSGPGTVTFGNANAVDTQASFSASGTYVLQLSASDGQLSASDQVQITVLSGGPTTDFRIATGPDDAEESAGGTVHPNSTDLELVYDHDNQTVGLRFTNVTVAKGATITTAYIQFQTDEAQSEITNLLIQGQATDNAPAITTAKLSLSTRARTAASVPWSPSPWTTVGETGPNQRTPELRSVIQEIVNRGGWASGNAMVILVTGTGHRTARAYEGSAAGAALLHIEVGSGTTNTAPSVYAGPDQAITLPAQATLDGTVSDDGLPSPPTVTTTWSKVSGPGTVTFGNANAVDTQASFSASGTYVLQLSASDGQLSASDQVQITVQAVVSNTAPTVSAGPDQTITLPAQATLDGTVSDDGLPSPPTVTTTWSKVSGPGTVTFGNANAVDTQASFSASGTYVLQLSASDGQLSASDQVQITVQPAGSTTTYVIASGPDDVEESATGSVYDNSTDLELVYDGSNQTVGLRFVNLAIPKGATIATASIQFQADEAQSEPTSLLIQGEASGNAAAFTTTKFGVSGRARTQASVAWNPVAWSTVGEAGANQRTPELKAILQEIVNRSDWVSGNSVVILITGTGHRTAEAFEGTAAGAGKLLVQLQ